MLGGTGTGGLCGAFCVAMGVAGDIFVAALLKPSKGRFTLNDEDVVEVAVVIICS